MKKKICFFVPHPENVSPSQRFRLEQYFSLLKARGFEVTVFPFLHQSILKFKSEKSFFSQAFTILASILRRPFQMIHALPCAFIFIHREMAPLGPPFFEWVMAKVFRKKVIYDFDDAIWTTDNTTESPVARALRWRSKVGSICRWSYKVSCGNPYLAAYAKQFNGSVVINPTTLDTTKTHTPGLRAESRHVTIGWTGSHSTVKYLEALVPVLQALEEKYSHLLFVVIADIDPHLPLRNYRFLPWNHDREIEDLRTIDIGVMPLPDDPWTRGKCGFKALQFMALEIPPVVSPVGVNREIVDHGVDGFWASTPGEWIEHLGQLIQNPEQRRSMGRRGREKVVARYSVTANAPTFLSLFQQA